VHCCKLLTPPIPGLLLAALLHSQFQFLAVNTGQVRADANLAGAMISVDGWTPNLPGRELGKAYLRQFINGFAQKPVQVPEVGSGNLLHVSPFR
jgi:hypothetical protein